jgi:hypothetical protein
MEEIKQSKQELLDCIQNLMGVFDTPVARSKIRNEFAEEARVVGRKILEENGINKYGI